MLKGGEEDERLREFKFILNVGVIKYSILNIQFSFSVTKQAL
jgi:hypothetical protein